MKVVRYNRLKKGGGFGKLVDESWEDISRLARIRAISPTEKGSSKLLSFIKVFTDRMSQ